MKHQYTIIAFNTGEITTVNETKIIVMADSLGEAMTKARKLAVKECYEVEEIREVE